MQTTILLPTDYTILQLKMALINICVQATNPIVKLRCRTYIYIYIYIYIYVICRSAQPFNFFLYYQKPMCMTLMQSKYHVFCFSILFL